MFEALQERLTSVFEQLSARGALTEKDVAQALREIRRALLEADVSLDIVRDFIAKVQEKATGSHIIKSIKPGQMVVKIVHDELVALLGTHTSMVDLNAPAPLAIMLVGLQGAGKTTTAAKLAYRLKKKHNKKVLLVSLDTRRPAAQEQLRQLGEQIQVDTLPIIAEQEPLAITHRALESARLSGFDVVLLDTAGRTTVDAPLMEELQQIYSIAKPHEVLLVADSLTGQTAVEVAQAFNKEDWLTGIILTRMDGDGRGGAALSMRAATAKPIKAIAIGEKIEDLEEFHPKRIANRILGMGDIVSLVEKASENINQEKAAALAKKLQAGQFDMEDFAQQLKQMQKLGGMQGLLSSLPGINKMKGQIAAAGLNDKLLTRQLAIISSMTKEERKNPSLLKHKRKLRIAKGSGTSSSEINKLLKMHRQMADMMKAMGSKNKAGFFQKMFGSAEETPPFSEAELSSFNHLNPSLKNLSSLDSEKGKNIFSALQGGKYPPINLPGLPKKK